MEQDPPVGLPAASALTLVTQLHSPYAVVRFAGEVDISSVGQVRTALRQLLVDGDVHLLLDLSAVTFMDSVGLGALVGIQKQARIFRGSLVVVAPSRPVRRIFELTSLDKVFRMCDTVEEALAQGRQGQHGRLDPVLD